MRNADTRLPEPSTASLVRMLRRGAAVTIVAWVAMSGAAHAVDDDDDDTFEEKIIRQIMTGIGGTNMDSAGIDYRERSPLVLPPRVNLPPPAEVNAVAAPNWPRDVEGERRKAARKASRNANKDPLLAGRPLMPNELAQKGARSTGSAGDDSVNPGSSPVLSPSQLGFSGNLTKLFGGNKTESAEFKSEPTRDSLTMPPPGYQTPSPNFAYGTGPQQSLNKVYSPVDGKYGD